MSVFLYITHREVCLNKTQIVTEDEKKDKVFKGKELRTMADANLNTQVDDVNTQVETGTDDVVNTAGEYSNDVNKLLAEVAELKAQLAKNKNSLDKTLREKGEITKQLRARQTAEEQEEEAKKEAERLRNEQFEQMSRELNHIKAVSAYKGKIGDDKIDTLIDAVTDNDHESIANELVNAYEKGKKDGYAEYLKSRPSVNAGSGSGTMTMDEIMAIKDQSERQRAIAQNIHLFDK